jgi:aryl carrier-like protein
MSTVAQRARRALIAFLQTIARPGYDMTQTADSANLLDEGALDSLSFVLVVEYLEKSHHVDFARAMIDPTRLTSIEEILRVILAAGRDPFTHTAA